MKATEGIATCLIILEVRDTRQLDRLFTRIQKIQNFISTEIIWSPLNSVIVAKEKMDTIIDFLDALEENDDVQNIFTNLKFGVE